MSGITDFEALRRALAENAERPEGPARNARAEELLTEAEKLDIPLAVIEALGHQVQVYNYSSEKDRCSCRSRGCCGCGTSGRRTSTSTRRTACTGLQVDDGGHAGPAARPARVDRRTGSARWSAGTGSPGTPNGPCAPPSSAWPRTSGTGRGPSGRTPRGWPPTATTWPTATPANCTARAAGRWSRAGTRRRLELWRPVMEGSSPVRTSRTAVLARSLAPLLRLGRVGGGARPPSAGVRLVRPMESMRDALRRPRGVLRAHRQRGTGSGAARGAARVLHGHGASAQPAGVPGRGGPADGPADRARSGRPAGAGSDRADVDGAGAGRVRAHGGAGAGRAVRRAQRHLVHRRPDPRPHGGGSRWWSGCRWACGRPRHRSRGRRRSRRRSRGCPSCWRGRAALGDPPAGRPAGVGGPRAGRRGRRTRRTRACRARRQRGDGPGPGRHPRLRGGGRPVRGGGRPRRGAGGTRAWSVRTRADRRGGRGAEDGRRPVRRGARAVRRGRRPGPGRRRRY